MSNDPITPDHSAPSVPMTRTARTELLSHDAAENLDRPRDKRARKNPRRRLRFGWLSGIEGLFWLALIIIGVLIELLGWCWQALRGNPQRGIEQPKR